MRASTLLPICIALMVLPVGLSANAKGADATTAPVAITDAPGPTKKPTPALKSQLKRLLRKVGRQRQLWPRGELKVNIGPPKQLEQLASIQGMAKVPQREIAYQRLGLFRITPGQRDRASKGRPTVLYDRHQKTLWLTPDLDLRAHRFALIHQLCRALLHQRLPLNRYLDRAKLSSDQRLARGALLRTDCLGLALELAVLKDRGADLGSAGRAIHQLATRLAAANELPANASTYQRRIAAFDYGVGLPFWALRRRYRSWRQLGYYYRYNPPRSTAELIHRRRRRPVRIRARTLKSLSNYSPLLHDTVGELQLSVLLERALSAQNADRVASGWRGDLLFAYRKKRPAPTTPARHPKNQTATGRTKATKKGTHRRTPITVPAEDPPLRSEDLIVISLSSWSHSIEAKEFAFAMARVATSIGRAEGRAREAKHQGYFKLPDGRWALLEWRRKAVLWAVGLPEDRLGAFQKEIWRRWTVGGRRVRPPRRSKVTR